jgi:hypothetical protein
LSADVNGVSRNFVLQLPLDLVLSKNTAVSSNSNSISSYTINVTTSRISITATGILNIRITNLNNPIKYNRTRVWNISTYDLDSNPSAIATALQEP